MHVAREMLGACIYAEGYYASSRAVIEVVSQKFMTIQSGFSFHAAIHETGSSCGAVYGKEE